MIAVENISQFAGSSLKTKLQDFKLNSVKIFRSLIIRRMLKKKDLVSAPWGLSRNTGLNEKAPSETTRDILSEMNR